MWTTPCFKHPLLAGQPSARMITIRAADDGCRWVILTRKHGFRGHQWWETKGIFDDAICVSTILARQKVKTIQKRQCHCPVQGNNKALGYSSLHISDLFWHRLVLPKDLHWVEVDVWRASGDWISLIPFGRKSPPNFAGDISDCSALIICGQWNLGPLRSPGRRRSMHTLVSRLNASQWIWPGQGISRLRHLTCCRLRRIPPKHEDKIRCRKGGESLGVASLKHQLHVSNSQFARLSTWYVPK